MYNKAQCPTPNPCPQDQRLWNSTTHPRERHAIQAINLDTGDTVKLHAPTAATLSRFLPGSCKTHLPSPSMPIILQNQAGSQSALGAMGGYCPPSFSTVGSQLHQSSFAMGFMTLGIC